MRLPSPPSPAQRILLHAGGSTRTAMEDIAAHLAGARRAVFLPYAGHDYDGYCEIIAQRFADIGIAGSGLHRASDPIAAIAAADAIIVPGGNTFRLAHALHRLRLIDPLRRAVAAGTPYVGASAGSNIASPTIRTTNDMPIVQPRSFAALNLVPFQINPHFIDSPPPGERVGETRDDRLREFLQANDVVVVGLREESWLIARGTTMVLRGTAGAMLFRRGHPPQALAPGADVSALLNERPRFDRAASKLDTLFAAGD